MEICLNAGIRSAQIVPLPLFRNDIHAKVEHCQVLVGPENDKNDVRI